MTPESDGDSGGQGKVKSIGVSNYTVEEWTFYLKKVGLPSRELTYPPKMAF